MLQMCTDNTASDNKPIIGVLIYERKENVLGSNIRWKVFNYFVSLTINFWKNESKVASTGEYCTNFTTLQDCLKAKCTTYFSLRNYHNSIPKELRMNL